MYHANRRFGQKPQHRLNQQIQASPIRVINEEGAQQGVMSTADALKLAQALRVDLIEIVPSAKPPVCQLCDYGRFLYNQNKRKEHLSHKLKEIQLSATIAAHDMEIKLTHTLDFLEQGNPVRVILQLRGREKAHPDIGQGVILSFIDKLVQAGYARPTLSRNGAQFSCLIQVKKSKPQPKSETNSLASGDGKTTPPAFAAMPA